MPKLSGIVGNAPHIAELLEAGLCCRAALIVVVIEAEGHFNKAGGTFCGKRRLIKENQKVLACTTKPTEVNSNELSWESSMSRFLDQIFSCRRDQYTGFPPHTLLEKCSIPTNGFDVAELAVELALVLCSIAVLTKRSGFWLAGIGSGLVGALIAVSVYVLH